MIFPLPEKLAWCVPIHSRELPLCVTRICDVQFAARASTIPEEEETSQCPIDVQVPVSPRHEATGGATSENVIASGFATALSMQPNSEASE